MISFLCVPELSISADKN